MTVAPADRFIEAVKPLLHLWQTVRVSGMACYLNGAWSNVGIRVQLQEHLPSISEIQSPDQRFMYYMIDYPLQALPDIVGQLTEAGSFTLEQNRGTGGAFAEISLKPPRPESGMGVHWYPPNKREPTPAQRKSGARRTSIVIISSGQMLHDVLDQDLRMILDSRLRLADPAHDGLAGLSKQLFPGAGFENWQQTLVEVMAELPFEIESTEAGKILVRASSRMVDGSLTTICFYGPQVGNKTPRTVLRRADDAEILDSTLLQWERILDWPDRAETAKVTLFYKEEEIQSIQLSRRAQSRGDLTQAPQIRTEKQARRPTPLSAPKQAPSPAPTKDMNIFKTALEVYRSLGIVGAGGAGVVHRVVTDDGQVFALKLLNADKATSQNRKRFKTELHFCANNEHRNIITVLDHGIALNNGKDCPFYVMPYYSKTLRDLMKEGVAHERTLPLFCQILNGVEAAHLKNVWHRDLKPENVLYDGPNETLLVADFGIAHFAEEELYTLVETGANDRLANFQYAAPEQRARGRKIDHRADIFALGLILNELFTGHVLQGVGYVQIGQVSTNFSYLDEIVEKMVQQSVDNRPGSIDEIKRTLTTKGNEFVSRQKLDALRQTVVPSHTATDPLIQNPIQVEDVDVRGDTLVAILSQAPPPEWIRVFVHPRAMSYIAGTEPANWRFAGNEAKVRIGHAENSAKQILNNFRDYVRGANVLYKEVLENAAKQTEENEKRALQQKIAEEERRQRLLKNLRS
jgi:serine/threonine protein kinase